MKVQIMQLFCWTLNKYNQKRNKRSKEKKFTHKKEIKQIKIKKKCHQIEVILVV